MDDTKRILGLPAFEQDAAFRRVLARMHGTEAPTATIGRYELIRRLGAGGMGIVYLVRDPILDRRVALKLLHDRLGHDADSDAFARRMRREAWAMARLHHPQVVRVYGVGEHEGRIFVVMEHVEGTTLADWLEARARGWDEVVRAFVAAGEGLAAAHEAGLVHGDFKAENVLVGDDGSIKVGDFGLVRSRGDVTEHGGPAEPGGAGMRGTTTRVGEVLGTPTYMAPEQLRGQRGEPRSDQFGFCVALHVALYGRPPFAGQTVHERLRQVQQGPRRPLARGTSVPPALWSILARGLSEDPSARWPSMAVLLEQLRDVQGARARRRRRLGLVGLGVMMLVVLVALARSCGGVVGRGGDGIGIEPLWNAVRAQVGSGLERARALIRARAQLEDSLPLLVEEPPMRSGPASIRRPD
ncbi:MAG: serine/threonine protein kinase [Myxococcales bacterium]|nr:serine/threonine protein kinase [Myxococcales bacterium]